MLWWLAARRGIPAELRIGARKQAGRFEAHAWVEMGNVVLNDSGEAHLHFAPFDGSIRFGGDADHIERHRWNFRAERRSGGSSTAAVADPFSFLSRTGRVRESGWMGPSVSVTRCFETPMNRWPKTSRPVSIASSGLPPTRESTAAQSSCLNSGGPDGWFGRRLRIPS